MSIGAVQKISMRSRNRTADSSRMFQRRKFEERTTFEDGRCSGPLITTNMIEPFFEPQRSDAWPEFEDGRIPVLCWTDAENQNRVFVLMGEEEMYTLHVEFFSEDDSAWCEENHGLSLFESKQDAIEAAWQA